MYIEVFHDVLGNISSCYCVDTLPCDSGVPLITIKGGVPAGLEQSRVNIDTLMAMEINAASGQRPALDANGNPIIVNVNRGQYIMQTFKVDTTATVTPPAGVNIPAGMNMRGLIRK